METEELDKRPSIVIPCETLNALRMLVSLLYELDILTDESIKFLNVPDGFDIGD